MTLPLSTITYYYVNVQSIALRDSGSGKFALTWIFEDMQFLITRDRPNKYLSLDPRSMQSTRRLWTGHSSLSLSLSLSLLPLSLSLKKRKDSHFPLTSTFFKTRCSNKVKSSYDVRLTFIRSDKARSREPRPLRARRRQLLCIVECTSSAWESRKRPAKS